MRIAVCDDDINHLKLIKNELKHYENEHFEQNFKVECFDNPFLFLESLNKTGGYDILLLDVFMPGILGIDIAKEIRRRQDKSEIIFLTTSADHAVEAFALQAAHYIIKPFTREQFIEALNRAVNKFKNKQRINVTLKGRNGEVRFVDLNEIMFVESYLHSQYVHLKCGKCIEVRQTLRVLSELFDEESKGQFISPYKGFLVNVGFIREIEPDKIMLKGGKQIPIVKRNYSVLKKKYFCFTFRRDGE